jgi:hypothetical protein
MFPKKKLSDKTLKLLAKGYEESADQDLEIAKDFEQIENELDQDSDT